MSNKKKTSCGTLGCFGLLILAAIGFVASQLNKQPSSEPVSPATSPVTKSTSPAVTSPVGQSSLSPSVSTPNPTPKVDIQRITAEKTLWPKTVSLKSELSIPVGSAGNVTLPVGSNLQLVSVGADGMLVVSWNGTNLKVRAEKTNLIGLVTIELNKEAELKAAADARRAAQDALPKPTQKEANAFYGITQQELIRRLGQPIRVTSDSSPDGPFSMLIYSDAKDKETFFTIFASDGIVDDGSLRGVLFSKSTADAEKVTATIGDKPEAMEDGTVFLVKDYLKDQLKDPSSLEVIEWSPVKLIDLPDGKAWGVTVKFRSKNSFGAYDVAQALAAVRSGKVIKFAIDQGQ